MSWDAKPKVNGGSFLRIDGSVEGVAFGEPFIYYQKKEDGKFVVVPESDPTGKFKFMINFILRENGAMVAKILDGGVMVFKALQSLRKAGYNLERTAVRITKTGSGLDTEYSVLPVPGGAISDEIYLVLKEVKLKELKK